MFVFRMAVAVYCSLQQLLNKHQKVRMKIIFENFSKSRLKTLLVDLSVYVKLKTATHAVGQTIVQHSNVLLIGRIAKR